MREYERHIVRTESLAWCGNTAYNFELPFQSVDHALLTLANEGRTVPCKACLEAAYSELGERLNSLEAN